MKKHYAVAYLFSEGLNALVAESRNGFLQRMKNCGSGVEFSLLSGRPYCSLYEFEADEKHELALLHAVGTVSTRLVTSCAPPPPIKLLKCIQRQAQVGVRVDKHHQIPQAHRLVLHECASYARKWNADELVSSTIPNEFHYGLTTHGYAYAEGMYDPYIPLAFVHDGTKVPLGVFDGFLVVPSDVRYDPTVTMALITRDEKGQLMDILTPSTLETAVS